jgi:hypothetical protein
MRTIRAEITFTDGETVTYKGQKIVENFEHDDRLYLGVEKLEGGWKMFPLDSIESYTIMNDIYN